MSYCTSPGWQEITMNLAVLAALALVIGLSSAAHADCVDTPCTTDGSATTARQAIDATLGSRIESALKDLEIANARALKADQQRMNTLCAAVNCANPEPTPKSSSGH
jgi:hypothetical protein